MNDLEDKPQQAPADERVPWERPRVLLVGTVALVVRGGSAQGKIGGALDGDTNQFQCKEVGACSP